MPVENPLIKPRFRLSRFVFWSLLGLFGLILACAFAFVLWLKFNDPVVVPGNPFFPPEMRQAQHASRDVVGDLGGMPVKIPRHFAEFMTYNDDPAFGEKRKGPIPPRTQASKIRSFGYYVRFPDMAGQSSPELRADKRRQSQYENMWISVGVTTGKNYPGDGFLERRASYFLSPENSRPYEKLPHKEHDLEVYALKGIDPKTQLPRRQHDSAEDVFVHRDANGKVDAYISCGHRPNMVAALCSHSLSLEPGVQAKLSLMYRRGLLPDWAAIQSAATQHVLNFRSTEAN